MAGIVDADTHIIEPADIWTEIPEAMYARRPIPVAVPTDTLYKESNAFWLIDGSIIPKPGGRGGIFLHTPSLAAREQKRDDIPLGARELTDPLARVAEMDRLGIDIQVVYPTLFIIYLTDDPQLEVALCQAYNRWMAEACDRTGGRIRWIAVLPLRSIEASLQEVGFAREHGAVGALFRGIEKDLSLADPYFYPVYGELEQADLPVCVHTGAGCPAWTNITDVALSATFPHVRSLPIFGFRDIVANRVPERFPTLRFGFIEAGASWVPYLLHQLHRWARTPSEEWGPQLFRDYRLFIACEADEDIPYLISHIGEDNIVIGSDYGHQDPSEERQMEQAVRGRGDLSPAVADKILCENARRLYALLFE